MVLNWISSMTRKASGTWSSDREDVMSVAAECFCGQEDTGQGGLRPLGISSLGTPRPSSPQRPRSRR